MFGIRKLAAALNRSAEAQEQLALAILAQAEAVQAMANSVAQLVSEEEPAPDADGSEPLSMSGPGRRIPN